MSTEKTVYFLELLRSETKGFEDEINRMYASAISEDERVAALKAFLDGYSFYHAIGEDMLKNGRKLLDRLYLNPAMALQTLQDIGHAVEALNNESSLCRRLMRSPEPFSDTVPILKKNETIAYLTALRQIAGVCVYLMSVYSGIHSVKDLFWSDNRGIQEQLYEINTRFLPALMAVERPSYSWVIYKRKLGGKALFGSDAFFLTYDSNQKVETLCCSLLREPIGTHAFLNVNAFETDTLDVPFCWGIGNIVSLSPNRALELLQHDVVTKIRSPRPEEYSKPMPSPLECLKRLSDNRVFCLSPDELTSAMNQWYIGHENEERRRKHLCLFCGGALKNRKLVCDFHFSTELK